MSQYFLVCVYSCLVRKRELLITALRSELIVIVLVSVSIQARPLKTKELADTEISSIIGEKMAQIHTLQVPISKEPTWLWETMNRWLSTATKILATPVAQDLFVDERGVSLDGSPAARIRSRFALHLDTEMVRFLFCRKTMQNYFHLNIELNKRKKLTPVIATPVRKNETFTCETI